MALKRPTAEQGQGRPAGQVECKALLRFPLLLSYLQDDKYDDGASRERSTVSVFVEDGRVKLALNDRQERRSLYVAADTLEAAWKALEAILGGSSPDWRSWNRSTKKGGK